MAPTTAFPFNMTVGPNEFIDGPADIAKIVSAVVLFVIVVLATYFPATCVRRTQQNSLDEGEESGRNFIPSIPVSDQRRRRKRILMLISCFNCFSGGVFLATGILDVFTDAQADVATGLKAYRVTVEFPLAAFSLLIGFFILLVIEQIVACHSVHDDNEQTQSERLLERDELMESDDVVVRSRRAMSLTASLDGIQSPRIINESRRRLRAHSEASEEFHDHFVETVKQSGSPIRSIFLVGAMSVHSLFEGLALGLETVPYQIYQLLGAISLHKTLLALGISLSLGQTESIRRTVLGVCSFIFAVMSPLGMIIGMSLTYMEHTRRGGTEAEKFKLVSGLLQGMACGTFLYVTFFEILPREINSATRPFQRTVYMLSLLAGFLCMSLFIYFL